MLITFSGKNSKQNLMKHITGEIENTKFCTVVVVQCCFSDTLLL